MANVTMSRTTRLAGQFGVLDRSGVAGQSILAELRYNLTSDDNLPDEEGTETFQRLPLVRPSPHPTTTSPTKRGLKQQIGPHIDELLAPTTTSPTKRGLKPYHRWLNQLVRVADDMELPRFRGRGDYAAIFRLKAAISNCEGLT